MHLRKHFFLVFTALVLILVLGIIVVYQDQNLRSVAITLLENAQGNSLVSVAQVGSALSQPISLTQPASPTSNSTTAISNSANVASTDATSTDFTNVNSANVSDTSLNQSTEQGTSALPPQVTTYAYKIVKDPDPCTMNTLGAGGWQTVQYGPDIDRISGLDETCSHKVFADTISWILFQKATTH
jgi:hypothetical protein